MSRISKSFSLLLIVLSAASTLIMAEPAFAQTPTPTPTANPTSTPTATYIPTPIPETGAFTYVLPNYVVNYTIIQISQPPGADEHAYAYNIVVYGPPPFPIQISFNETTYYGAPQNMTIIMSVIVPTDSLSTSIGCLSYPTQITMIQASNESVPPSPTPTTPTSPSPVPSPTSSPAPTQSLPSPNLSFSCISSMTSSGFSVQIQGSLTYDGEGLSDAGIQLSDSITAGATWQDLTYVYTDNNGSFTCVWTPSVSGNYGLEATWSGDSNYSSVNAVYNFAVAPSNSQNVFSVTSNSTLTTLTFDSTTNELSFSVSGPSGTTGLTTVCIPQSLISDISKLTVTLDGAAINHNSVSVDNVWLITFTYHHSSHTVVIAFGSQTSTVPEFPTWIILPLFAIAILLSTIIIRKSKNSV